MRGQKSRSIVALGLIALVAAVVAPSTQANPPFAGATYTGTTSQGLSIVLVVNEAGSGLAAGSYVDFLCGTNPPARVYLDATSLLLPAGVTNRNGTGGVVNADGSSTPGFEGGTLSWRFFARFFGTAGGAGGQTQPPGDQATGDFSGRNVTGIPGGAGFCSFRATWTVAMTPPA